MKSLLMMAVVAAMVSYAAPVAAQHHGGGHGHYGGGHHGGGHYGGGHYGGGHRGGGHSGYARPAGHGVHQDHLHHRTHYHGHYAGYPYYVGYPYYPYHGYPYVDGYPYAGGAYDTAPADAAVAAPPPFRPTFGLGLWTSSTRLQGDVAADGYGAVARLPGRGIHAELELGKDRWERSEVTGMRLGGAVLLDLVRGGVLVPYLAASAGMNFLRDAASGATARQAYLAGGAGLGLGLTDRLQIAADLRWSSRRTMMAPHDCCAEPGTARAGTPTTPPPALPSRQAGVEARLAAIYYF